jgi:UDP-2,3-diacylglucosamine hydrolase
MSVFFISDLHLRTPQDKVAKLFLKFLSAVPVAGDHLILGGDLFDLFVGNKPAFTEPFSVFIAAISALPKRGVTVYYAEGNHDFQLKNVFGSDVNIHADTFAITLPGVKICVSHGDRIDPQDHGYHLLRFVTRSLPVKALVKTFPNKLLRQLGEWSSRQSRKYNNADRLPTQQIERSKNLFRTFAQAKWAEGFDWVFLGHSHLADHWQSNGKNYINLGYSEQALLYARGEIDTRQIRPLVYNG